MITRRTLLAAAVATPAALASPARAQAPRELRIGYQKNGILVVAKQQRAIENRLKPFGVEVKWIEFSFGPPLLEALNIGSVDFGATGDAPPIFAQAAGANLLYVAAQPAAGSGAAILLPKGSSIQSLADLKGKRVAFAKASSAHNLTVAALEKAGLTYKKDIQPLTLAPADAAAAFARGSVDAWTIWDPFFAIAEKGEGVRVLALARDIIPQTSFFLANRTFTERNGTLVRAVIDELATVAGWSQANRGEVAKLLAEGTGVELEATRRAVDRTDFVIEPVSAAVAAEQQRIADRFHALGLIPKPIDVRAIVWTPPAS